VRVGFNKTISISLKIMHIDKRKTISLSLSLSSSSLSDLRLKMGAGQLEQDDRISQLERVGFQPDSAEFVKPTLVSVGFRLNPSGSIKPTPVCMGLTDSTKTHPQSNLWPEYKERSGQILCLFIFKILGK